MNKEWICLCGRTFKTSNALNAHKHYCKIGQQDTLNRQKRREQEKQARKLPNGMFKCENCGNEYDGSYGSGRFCSKACKDLWNALKSVETRRLRGTFISGFTLSTKSTFTHKRASYGTWKCEYCNDHPIFETRRKLEEHKRKFHPIPKGSPWNKGLTKTNDIRILQYSRKISNVLKGRCTSPKWTDERREKMTRTCKRNKLSGGYRPHGGKGHRGRYKGIWCDSSWELALVIYWLEHGIQFSRCNERFEYVFEGEIHRYNPDFLLSDGIYVEVKGWEDERWHAKVELFPSNKILKILKLTDIQPYLKYVEDKYGKDFIRLYEEK